MGSLSEQVHLCLAILAYAGLWGPSARADVALHKELEGWLGRVGATSSCSLVWGPTQFRPWWQPSVPSVMMFVVAPTGVVDAPLTIVVRGGAPVRLGDTPIDWEGSLTQEPWIWARDEGELAPAICGAVDRQLRAVREMTPEEGVPGAGRTLPEFLAECVEASPRGHRLSVGVTGHGAGGTLATAAALWLLDTQGSSSARAVSWDARCRAKVHCRAFAGPTVGNVDFARYLGERMGEALDLVHNSLDAAPLLWDPEGLSRLPELYLPQVREAALSRAVGRALSNEIERCGIDYEQPPARSLKGTLNVQLPASFAAQAEYQHLQAYLPLLGLGPDTIDLDALLGRRGGVDGGPVSQ